MRLNDQPRLKMATFEIVLRPAPQIAAMADRIMDASEQEAANSVGVADETLTPQVRDRPALTASPRRFCRLWH